MSDRALEHLRLIREHGDPYSQQKANVIFDELLAARASDAPPNEEATRLANEILTWHDHDLGDEWTAGRARSLVASLAAAPSPNVRERELERERDEAFERVESLKGALAAGGADLLPRVRQLEQVLREIADSTHGPGGSRRRGPWLARLKSMARAAL